ncbi:hypothetical protein JZ751_002266 [Albula glossodonta]|uniref:Sialate O-acetylesterase domain-containing protein n=1 Tax=Albula glossodonta TaxID=121402 RepID=A0A8T2P9C1_9TELE|nr:hypothetical protein JZ751_002266 [Albula glossodonta]
MVLQKAPERAVLWGYGLEGSKVMVVLQGEQENKVQSAHVQNGTWRVTLDPVEAGGPYNVTAFQLGPAEAKITLIDVLFGDVWLCGGQSNMYLQLSKVFNASEEQALAPKFPNVRIFMASLELSKKELIDLPKVEIPWSVPSPELLGNFSAVCWLFGRYLYKTLRYPVGLVESCWGGTPVEAWSSSRALQKCGLEADDGSYLYIIPGETGPEPKRENSVLWNAMIHPLVNMTIKGAIWYQGEDNTIYHLDKYACSFPAMIDDWRATFHEGSGGQTAADFPFGFVQLCTPNQGHIIDKFARLRWHQTADYGFTPNTRMKNTFMAVSLDLPDKDSPWGSIHPRDKQDVAYRLMLGAQAMAYGEKGVSFQGPFPAKIMLSGDIINITYTQTISVTKSKTIFEVCCTEVKQTCSIDSKWVSAPIMQWGQSSVQVSTELCEDIVSGLRHAWSDWPCEFKACPVYSADRELPAPPFTLNRWP